MRIVMEDKLSRQKRDPGLYPSIQSLGSTKDYLDKIIHSSRLTFANLDEEEESDNEFSDLDDFRQYWTEQGIAQTTLNNLEAFIIRFNKVFGNTLEFEYVDDRVRCNAIRESGRKRIICSLQVHPSGLVIRAGNTHRIGVSTEAFKNIRVKRLFDSVDKIQERDINPMKQRYKDFMNVSKVPNRWMKVNDSDADEDLIEDTLVEQAVTEEPRPAMEVPSEVAMTRQSV